MVASMTQRTKAEPLRTNTPSPLADEKIQMLAEQLLEAMACVVGDDCEFAEFEQRVLVVSNDVCRQTIKKNSRR